MSTYVINGDYDSSREVDAEGWQIRDDYFHFAKTGSDGFSQQVYAVRASLVQTVELKQV